MFSTSDILEPIGHADPWRQCINLTELIRLNYRVGQIKRGQCSFFRPIVKHVLQNFDNNSSFTHFKKKKIKYLSPEGTTEANDFLCIGLVTINRFIYS